MEDDGKEGDETTVSPRSNNEASPWLFRFRQDGGGDG